MTRAPNDMLQGYLDGIRADSPEPGENRSHSYRQGFANGLDDLRHGYDVRPIGKTLRDWADREKDRTA